MSWSTLSAAYLLSQRGHHAVSSGFRISFILAPQDGHSKLVRRFIFSTTNGFVRAWLKSGVALVGRY
jgi:hypothetical protein